MTKIVIVGSANLRTMDFELPGALVSAILAIVTTLPPDAEVGVRGPANQPGNRASMLEEWVHKITQATGRRAEIYRPIAGGRNGVFQRDYDLVDGSSHVYAYFDPHGIMEGGTGHVVKAALDRNIPVEAWTVSEEDGQLVLVGSDDGAPPATPEELAQMWDDANAVTNS